MIHTTPKGILAMSNLLLNSLAVRQQATGIQTKKLVSKMLTICSLSGTVENQEHEERAL
jgi:hypothetical protein